MTNPAKTKANDPCNDEALPLENAMQAISTLIDEMEHSELSLAQSLTHFERGITLVKHCQKILEQAEQKVQILLQKNSQATLVDYENKDITPNDDDPLA